MTEAEMRLLVEHYDRIGTNFPGPVKVYPNYEAPVIQSTVTPEGVRRSMTMMHWGFPAPPFYKVNAKVTAGMIHSPVEEERIELLNRLQFFYRCARKNSSSTA